MIEQQALRGRRSALSWPALFTIALALLLSAFASAPIAADLRGHSAECRENAEGRPSENRPAPWVRTTDSGIVHTIIGGQEFFVPLNYFQHPQIGCGVEEDAMLLRVLLPDLKPYSEETKRVFETTLGIGSYLNILVLRSSKVTSLRDLAKVYTEGGDVEPAGDRSYGLLLGKHIAGDDVFFSDVSGEIHQVIVCSPFRENRGAICSHHFRHLLHHVTLTYGRDYLESWEEIEGKVEGLLDRFATSP